MSSERQAPLTSCVTFVLRSRRAEGRLGSECATEGVGRLRRESLGRRGAPAALAQAFRSVGFRISCFVPSVTLPASFLASAAPSRVGSSGCSFGSTRL